MKILDSEKTLINKTYGDHDEMNQTEGELVLLQNVNNLINLGMDLQAIFDKIVNGLRELYGYDSVAIHLLSKDQKHLIIKSYSADSKIATKFEKITKLIVKDYKAPLYKGSILKDIIETRSPVITDDIRWVLNSYTDKKSLKKFTKIISKITNANWGMGVPLLAGDKLMGVIGCGSKNKLTDEDSQRLLFFGYHVGLAIQRAQRFEALEGEVRERCLELASSEEKFYSLIQTVKDAIISINETGMIVLWNQAAGRIFGYSEYEVIGKPIDIIIPDNYQKKHSIDFDQFLKGKMEEDDGKTFELDALKKDGSVFPAELSLSVDITEDGRIFTGILRDITYRRRAMKALEKANIELKRADELKMQFLNITSHELRTPITPMIAQLQMILEGFFGSLVEDQKKSLIMILNNAKRLNRLIGEILDISRLETGEMKFYMKTNCLNDVMSEAIETMKPKAKTNKINLTFSQENTVSCVFDKDRIIQVVINLINNAIKFTDPGGIIEVKLFDENNSANIHVSDNGIGIDDNDLRRIFRPFEQVDSTMTRNHEGVGLGLAICKGIIISHGGKIKVESEVGKGTNFIFTLPYNLEIESGNTKVDLFNNL